MTLAAERPRGRSPAFGRHYLRSGWLLRDLASGTIVAAVSLAYYVSYAALLFSGPLEPALPVAVAAVFAAGAIIALASAYRSSYPFATAGPEPNATAVLAVAVGGVGAALPLHEAVPTAVAAMALAAFTGGAALWLCGHFRLASWIRYVPYPVMGGFVAATGWLIVTGALKVAAGVTPSWAAVRGAVLHGPDPRLAAAAAVAALFWVVVPRLRHALAMPVLLAAAVAAVHGGRLAAGMDVDAARAAGWLFDGFDSGLPPVAWDPAVLAQVRWDVLGTTLGTLAAVVVVNVLLVLLVATGLEVATRREADLDRDLRGLGLANLLSAAGGGTAGGYSLSRSVLARQAGAATRFSSVVVALICAAALLGGGGVIGHLPPPVLGGLLLYLGLTLLREWVVRGPSRLSRGEYAVVLLILAVTVLHGFLLSLVVGLIAACLEFAVNCGRLGAVHRSLSGAVRRSRVDRSPPQARLLNDHGGAVRILELRGFLFFGTASAVAGHARALFRGDPPVRFLVLDLSRVTGIDSSAGFSFAKIGWLARRANGTLVFCGLTPAVRAGLDRHDGIGAGEGGALVFDDLDQALEWCEERLVATLCGDDGRTPGERFRAWLAAEIGDGGHAGALLGHLRRRPLAAGDVLFREGDPADGMYLLESGRVSAWIDPGDGSALRVRTILGSGMVGEMGLYRGAARSATIVADEAGVAWFLDTAGLERLGRDNPGAASAFHRMVVRILAERLHRTNAQIAALQA